VADAINKLAGVINDIVRLNHHHSALWQKRALEGARN
jgi:hypothetical protein